MLTFIKESLNNTKLNFYLFTLLLILNFVTWIPFFGFQEILSPLKLESYNFIIWITKNENYIFSFYVAFLYIESLLFLLSLVTWKFGIYFNNIKPLTDFFIITGANFLLLLQLAHNLNITTRNINDIPVYYFSNLNPFIGFFPTFSYAINFFIIFTFLCGYFHKPKAK